MTSSKVVLSQRKGPSKRDSDIKSLFSSTDPRFSTGLGWEEGRLFLPVPSPNNPWPLSLPHPLLTEATWAMALDADGNDCYSTGSVPGQQGQPDDLNHL